MSKDGFQVFGLKKWWTSLEEMSVSTVLEMWSMRLILKHSSFGGSLIDGLVLMEQFQVGDKNVDQNNQNK